MPNIGGMRHDLMNKGGQRVPIEKGNKVDQKPWVVGRDLKAGGYVSLYSVGRLTIRSFFVHFPLAARVCVLPEAFLPPRPLPFSV
jgi:hypothetical protein